MHADDEEQILFAPFQKEKSIPSSNLSKIIRTIDILSICFLALQREASGENKIKNFLRKCLLSYSAKLEDYFCQRKKIFVFVFALHILAIYCFDFHPVWKPFA